MLEAVVPFPEMTRERDPFRIPRAGWEAAPLAGLASIDLNQNGVFETATPGLSDANGELIAWNGGCCAQRDLSRRETEDAIETHRTACFERAEQERITDEVTLAWLEYEEIEDGVAC